MKRFLTILILIALTGTLAACATPVKAPSSAVHDDPIGEYEAMQRNHALQKSVR